MIFSSFVTIQAGERGIIFRPFTGGLDRETIYQEGFQLVAPWNTMFIYDVRLQEVSEEMDVLASNGLSIQMDLSFRYRPIDKDLGRLHDEIGVNYLDKLVKPELRSAVRKVIGKYKPEELYSTQRTKIQDEIEEYMKDALGPRYIASDAVLIRSIQLPAKISEAIEMKLRQEQEALQYEFRLQQASKEAERKAIEAKGIAERQRIISQGLTPQYLKFLGIEATQKLAESTNSKVVIIGDGKTGGLPIILGGQ
jgi:regulator of protease activity HflC (stomatin/prohibitin superfamily)